jgi:DNA-binding CsgD family transcriptional regulator
MTLSSNEAAGPGPVRLSERQVTAFGLALRGLDTAAVAAALDIKPSAAQALMQQAPYRTGIHGRYRALLALVEAGLLELPAPSAERQAQWDKFRASDQSGAEWLSSALELYMLNCSWKETAQALGRHTPPLKTVAESVGITTSTINQAVVDNVYRESVRIQPDGPLLFWGPLLWHLLMGYTTEEMARSLCNEGYLVPATSFVNQWLSRLASQCGETDLVPVLLDLVRQKRLRLPQPLRLAADRLQRRPPAPDVRPELARHYYSLPVARLSLGVKVKDPFGLCNQLRLANWWQVRLVATYLGWL